MPLIRTLRNGLASALALAATTLPSLALDTKARAALVIDHATGTVLLEKDANTPLPPASMSKLMTLYMVFEALKEGRLALDDTFRVSTRAWQMGGSKMFLREGDNVRVEDLIRGIIVQSGNDACVVLAEGLAGSEEAFAIRMTQRARDLGMMESTFANSTGWPHPDHRMSARDLVTIARLLVDEFPEYYPYFAETSFTWEGIDQNNRNPLLGLGLGADGLKTGHTEAAGYGLVGSAVQDGRRVTLMITGLDSTNERLVEAERLMTWAFREFYGRTLFEADAPVTRADVWLGESGSVDLVPIDDITAVIPYAGRDKVEIRVEYQGPIEAPLAHGDTVAELVVSAPDLTEARYPLTVAVDVPRGGFATRLKAATRVLADQAMTAALGVAE